MEAKIEEMTTQMATMMDTSVQLRTDASFINMNQSQNDISMNMDSSNR